MLLSALLAGVLASCPPEDLTSLTKTLGSAAEPEARTRALEGIHALYAEGEPQAVEVSRAAARAFEDESLAVRARAAELFGASFDFEVATATLSAAAKDYATYEERFLAGIAGRHQPLPDPKKTSKEDYLAKLRAATDGFAAEAESLRAMKAYRGALVTALGRRRDDRSVDALGALLAARPTGADATPVIERLLVFGTVPALLHVVDALREFEKLRSERAQHAKKLARRRPEKEPDYWRGTKDAWEARERERLAKSQRAYEEKTAALDAWAAEVREQLVQFAEAHGLAAPPREALPYRQWKSWAGKARNVLPKSLAAD